MKTCPKCNQITLRCNIQEDKTRFYCPHCDLNFNYYKEFRSTLRSCHFSMLELRDKPYKYGLGLE